LLLLFVSLVGVTAVAPFALSVTHLYTDSSVKVASHVQHQTAMPRMSGPSRSEAGDHSSKRIPAENRTRPFWFHHWER